MASLEPATVQDLMDEIYVNVDNDPTSSTDSTQDEWTARLRLIISGIRKWEAQDVAWNELWTYYTHPTPITTTNSYLMTATDYRHMPGSFLMFTTAAGTIIYLDIIKPDQAPSAISSNARRAYVTGSGRTGYTINLTFTPLATDQLIGLTMSLYYYRSAFKPTVATDLIEMGDPSYLISFVSAKKNLFNGRTEIAQDFLDDAQD